MKKMMGKRPVASVMWVLTVFFHLVFLFCLWLQPAYSLNHKNKQQVLVKTIQLNPKPAEKKPKSIESKETRQEKREAKPIAKIPKPLPKKNEKSRKKKVKERSGKHYDKKDEKQSKLIASLRESIDSLDESFQKDREKVSLDVPSKIKDYNVDNFPNYQARKWSHGFDDYQDVLKRCLKKYLKLPEYGTVKVRLIIAKNGRSRVL